MRRGRGGRPPPARASAAPDRAARPRPQTLLRVAWPPSGAHRVFPAAGWAPLGRGPRQSAHAARGAGRDRRCRLARAARRAAGRMPPAALHAGAPGCRGHAARRTDGRPARGPASPPGALGRAGRRSRPRAVRASGRRLALQRARGWIRLTLLSGHRSCSRSRQRSRSGPRAARVPCCGSRPGRPSFCSMAPPSSVDPASRCCAGSAARAGGRLAVAPAAARAEAAVGAAVVASVGVLSLPLAARSTRDRPWWDYRAWNLFGGGKAVTFEWSHGYGPLDWPRDGTTLLNVESDRPHYWKAETLDTFDGLRWIRTHQSDNEGVVGIWPSGATSQPTVELFEFNPKRNRQSSSRFARCPPSWWSAPASPTR